MLLRAQDPSRTLTDGDRDPDAHFAAQQNARLVANAEEYYRTMMLGNIESWNVRDMHMARRCTRSTSISRASAAAPG